MQAGWKAHWWPRYMSLWWRSVWAVRCSWLPLQFTRRLVLMACTSRICAFTVWHWLASAIGYIVRSKSAAEKQTGTVALTSQLLGSVSEPTIYGILFRNKTCLIVEVVASGIAGFYCGLTHTAVVGMTFSLPVVGSFLAFSGASTANMVNGAISLLCAFAAGTDWYAGIL